MNIVIIPGFTGYPEEMTFIDLGKQLSEQGHRVVKIAWPHFPDDLERYSFTETIKYSRSILESLSLRDTIILGFSMGGIIATF